MVTTEIPPAASTPAATPLLLTGVGGGDATALVLDPTAEHASVCWFGAATEGLDPVEVARSVQEGTAVFSNQGGNAMSVPLLPEVARLWFGRPGLAGHRIGGEVSPAGQDWSTTFTTAAVTPAADGGVAIEAVDVRSGLALRTEIEPMAGGSLRVRHRLTNTGQLPYVVDHLEVALPVDARVAEILDLTGRWGRERAPQRHAIAHGVWLRDGRTGRPGFDSATQLVVGEAGFGFGAGRVFGVHVAWSGNTRHFVERQPSGLTTIGGGELLLPGELVLGPEESYTMPWVVFTASRAGLDGLSNQLHRWVRSLPAHPSTPRPVVCNVWEAVYFDHDLARLHELADRAAEIGMERFVLDDGWFGSRRDDTSGLGDWTISPDVWPDGLGPLIERVEANGLQFGLWFEPEMVNRDSELYRAHPEWALRIDDREPLESRNQLVLDLGRPEVREYLFGQIDAVLAAYPIRYVKWDHNRPLADAGSGTACHAPGVREQTLGFYRLLDDLRAAHPDVEWESCASGGGRIDLGVIERVERFWTSDMTDALSRQLIQRWTGQLVPPEYVGAHVSAPTNHQTGRQLPLDFRAATAFFGSLGVEWDVTSAGEADRARLAEWIAAYKQHRAVLHSGRAFRLDTGQPEIYAYGVVAEDAAQAVVAYVQLDELVTEPEPFLVPGLDPNRRYRARQIVPAAVEDRRDAPPAWRGEGMVLSGATLAEVGLPAPFRAPISSLVVHLSAE